LRRQPLPAAALAALIGCAALLFAGFLALGTWQVERRAWKLDLIERVERRVHSDPVDAPGPGRWPQVNAADDEYRHVRIAGSFLHDRETLVQASTRLGPGFWVLTPLRTAQGTVLVNRGFVPPERRDRAARSNEPDGTATVTGLLRLTEPGGGFLRRNDPAAGRWHSRDVQAIAAARGLPDVAPFFIDAEAQPPAGAEPQWPAGGLTVVAFRNHHLGYALTWYALAAMVAAAAWLLARSEWRLRRRTDAGDTPRATRD